MCSPNTFIYLNHIIINTMHSNSVNDKIASNEPTLHSDFSEFCWGQSKKRKYELDETSNKYKSSSKKHKHRHDRRDTHDDSSDDSEENHVGHSGDIYSYDNHVYFYSNVNKKTMLIIQKELRRTVVRMKRKMRNAQDSGLRVEYEPIFVHIYSPGGGIFAVFSFIDYLSQLKHKYPEFEFHSIVEGSTASAGTLMSVVFDKRIITEYGYMLIHQLSSGTWGKYNDIKDDVKNLDTLMVRIKNIYKKHCNLPNEKLNEILSHDIYWDAPKCLKFGLVDEIITNPINKKKDTT